ncbi:Rho GTPase-activating protein 12 [Blattella germanica]|nr:Rho GTPase-activating protein 12 [Blattella germanica]
MVASSTDTKIVAMTYEMIIVESHGIRHYSSPPSPSPGLQATRALHEGWEEYQTPQGRTFYYNRRTRDKSWKPPRRQHRHSNENAEDGSIENLRSDSSSPLAEANGSCGTSYVPVPKGWREAYDEDTCQPCYVNDATGAKKI